MNIKVVAGTLIVSALLMAAPSSSPCLAQSQEVAVAASTSASKNVGSTKHRYWRHRGGRHPHYGSRRVRT